MPVQLSILGRLAFFRLNRTPAPLLDLFGAVGLRTAGVEHVERTTFRTLSGIALLEAEKLKKSTQ